ncbi:MAG: LPXTG cell wall anchor domain-containing protein [Nanoarchaeota archaeon]
MAQELNTSLVVLYSIIFLFIVFLVIGQPRTTTLVTLPLIGDTENISLTTTIIIAVGVLVIAAGIFLLYKKFIKKKQLEVPKPENLPELTSQLSSLELSNKETSELTEEDINKLFVEGEQPKEELTLPEKKEKQVIQQKEKQTNYKELRALILNLLNKNYTHDSIINYLKTKGYNLTQIKKVIDGINQSNLSRYIGQCISLRVSKDEIIKNLLSRGWSLEEIKRQL